MTTDSNLTSLQIARETSAKTLPTTPSWFNVEVNSYSSFGAKTTLEMRNIINVARTQLEGSIVNYESDFGFEMDLTKRNANRLLPDFFCAAPYEKPDTFGIDSAKITISAVDAGAGTYAAASGLDSFLVGSLVWATGFTNAANNGLKNVSASAAGLLTVSQSLTTESAPPSDARLSVCGVQAASGDLALVATASAISLSSTILDFTTLGLTVGETIAIGGDATVTQFDNNAPFFATILTISANVITFNNASLVVTSDAGAAKTIQLFFGVTMKNEVTDALITKRYVQAERTLGSDGVGIQSEYVTGALANELKVNLALASKVSMNLGYIGLDTEYRTGTEGVKSGNRYPSYCEGMINTSTDIYQFKLALNAVNFNTDASLFALASDGTITINNGVTKYDALGSIGFDHTLEDFKVSASVTAFFQNVDSLSAIRNNSPVGLYAILTSGNAGHVISIPSLNMSGGEVSIEKNKKATLALENSAFGTCVSHTCAISIFHYLPNALMTVV